MDISLITDASQNFTAQVSKALQTANNSLIVCGGISTLDFSIPYFDATSGNSNWGITLYTESNKGSLNAIDSSSNINGNGITKFSWIASPGIYDGFKVVFTNEYGTTSAVYNEPFDVASGLVSVCNPENNNPCIPDSSASAYFNSSGDKIGYLVITATIGGHNVLKTNGIAQIGLQMAFISISDNVTNNNFKYGILNYEQSWDFTGAQNGHVPTIQITPYNSASEVPSKSQATSNTDCKLAEASIYDLVESGLFLSDYGIGIGLAMAALGPILFKSETGGSSSYWNKNQFRGTSFTFNNTSAGQGTNFPNPTKVDSYNKNGAECSNDCTVFPVVNNGNGDPSYIQNLNIGMQVGYTGLEYGNDSQLEFFDYNASTTIVPIWYLSGGLHFGQNDYAYAKWVCTQNPWDFLTWGQGHYEYSGPSYNIATSLPIYFAIEG